MTALGADYAAFHRDGRSGLDPTLSKRGRATGPAPGVDPSEGPAAAAVRVRRLTFPLHCLLRRP